ncbi:MAG TPA: maleylacetoacetate isomerase [Rhodanobacteraceae bacterium]|nr:maleylacetoacetate isomerase [Rhodanobacteraceae bacterium]
MSQDLVLYGYWRSSAAYRVRIALNLKELAYVQKSVHLVRDGGQQHTDSYRKLHPQELVPTLLHGQRMLRQSLAIVEYLDETWPNPALLPPSPRARAQARALAQVVACDIHPIGNLRVLQYLDHECGMPQVEREQWSRHWIEQGFKAFEAMLEEDLSRGRFCCGDTPGLADICLIPQVYNALRWGVDMQAFPTINAIHAACQELEAFRLAAPEAQPDAPKSEA